MIRARVCVCAVHFFFKFHSSFSLEQFLWSIFEAVESPHRLSIAIQSFRILCVFFSASLLCCCCCCCFYFLLSVKCVRMCVPLCVGVKLLVFFVFDSVSFRAHSQSFRAYCNYMNLFFHLISVYYSRTYLVSLARAQFQRIDMVFLFLFPFVLITFQFLFDFFFFIPHRFSLIFSFFIFALVVVYVWKERIKNEKLVLQLQWSFCAHVNDI